MIIDSHTHIGFNEHLHETATELVDSMREAKIDKAVVCAGDINDCSTEKLIESLKPFNGILYPVGSVSPLSKSKPSAETVENWLKGGTIVGLKFYPAYEPFYPNGEEIRPYLEILEKYKKPAIFHSGDTFNLKSGAKIKYAHPLHIDDIAVDFPNIPIVIAHLGYPWIIDAAEIAYKNKNVFADCSGMAYGKFDEKDKNLIKKMMSLFIEYSGDSSKIMFGTDWPISDQSDYVEIFKDFNFSNSPKDFFGATAEKIFGLI